MLAAADAVPVPQRAMPFAESQLPAKLLDAMSMAKPIVASRVGDLTDILGHGDRGWLVEPGSPGEVARALAEIEASPREAARRGANARQWFLAEASASTIRQRLHTMIQTGLK
ncbi:MAG: glycosyltransferase family 4 protein [Candidatus Solibacter usitatus]|nr:glycosyltransferase family 4 protein [Candidatus Solibacter usitatus]